MRVLSLARASALAVVLSCVSGCPAEPEPPCTTGTTRACTCGTEAGEQTCSAGRYGTCICASAFDTGPRIPDAYTPPMIDVGPIVIPDAARMPDAGTDAGGTIEECEPGATRTCMCGAQSGFARCRSDGTGYAACNCTPQRCTPGSSESCTCGSASGTRACLEDGSDFGMCMCGPTCGDALCLGTETCTSCPTDCGSCGCSLSESGGRFTDSCGSDAMCRCNASARTCTSGGTCTALVAVASYRLELRGLTVSMTNAEGGAWDTGFGSTPLPDPYLVLTRQASGSTSTTTVHTGQDSYADDTTMITTPIDLGMTALRPGDELTFTVWDDDVSFDDMMGPCTVVVTAPMLRAHRLSCAAPPIVVGIDVALTPQF